MSRLHVSLSLCTALLVWMPSIASAGDSDDEITIESVDGGAEDEGAIIEEVDMTESERSSSSDAEEGDESPDDSNEDDAESFSVEAVADSAEGVSSSSDRGEDRSDETGARESSLESARRALRTDQPAEAISTLFSAHPDLADDAGGEHPIATQLLVEATVRSGGAFEWGSEPASLDSGEARQQLDRALNLARNLQQRTELDVDDAVGRAIGQLAGEEHSAHELLERHRSKGGTMGPGGFRALIDTMGRRGLQIPSDALQSTCREMTDGAGICRMLETSLYGDDGLPKKIPTGGASNAPDADDVEGTPSRKRIDRAQKKLDELDF